ncbi:MAG: alpha-galactosidase [Candidatus Omnitrophica bacterium]|nr:alpha-galactosidase [Candidatus Omnitrophota bacterium]
MKSIFFAFPLALFFIHAVDCFSQPSLGDWLIQTIADPVRIEEQVGGKELVISNGLIARTFRMEPNLASISFQNRQTGEEFIRGVKPEALIAIDGRDYPVGGLLGQPDYGYLAPEWLDSMTSDPAAFQLTGYSIGDIAPRFAWKRKRYGEDRPWPPLGKSVSFHFTPPQALQDSNPGLILSVHYEMYQGIPVLAKWATIDNGSEKNIVIDRLTVEMLAVMERVSEVNLARSTKPRLHQNYIDPNDLAEMSDLRIHVQSDYTFCGGSYLSSDQTTFWTPDDQYQTQVNYDRTWPHLLTCRYPYGPAASLPPGEAFTSFRTYELLHDSDDRERRGLAVRRMHRVLTPWCTENPLMLHLRYSDSESIRRAVDQCAETGFEMIILSFGSGVNMESDDPQYMERLKADFDYAHSRGIEIGGYSLLASRSAGPDYNVIDPNTGEPGAYFGQSPCLVSEWGERYFKNLKNFILQTGCDILEHDGSYPGDVCASTRHKGHRGLEDSQWAQFRKISEFYHWCRENGVYLNVPDYYFLNGANKTAMGYRETNWSLPRERQIIHGRQNIYDGTWFKTPSMGWMFVPLVEYHGGGAAATIEPLREHLDTYEAFLAQNLGSGVQACYRGPRLYDADETKAVVKRWVNFYKNYRPILDSDIIHLCRPDGRDWDGILHVNPQLKTRGFAMLFNPSKEVIERTIALPLYYAGLTDVARVREKEGEFAEYTLDREYRIELPVRIDPQSWTWFVIE